MLTRRQAGSALRSGLVTLAIIAALIALAATLLPRGFSDDVSRIGQGRPAVVLVHDKESVLSFELMTLLGNVRGDYEDRVEFLAVDTATERGQDFMRRQRVDEGALVLFAADGDRAAVLGTVRDEAALRAAIARHLGLPGS